MDVLLLIIKERKERDRNTESVEERPKVRVAKREKAGTVSLLLHNSTPVFTTFTNSH